MALSSDDELSGLTQSNEISQEFEPIFSFFDIPDLGEVSVSVQPIVANSSTDTTGKIRNDTRNVELISDECLEKVKESRIPENTKLNTGWAVRVWKDWSEERNRKALKISPNERLVKPNILDNNNDELKYWLAKFAVEIRKRGEEGQFYPANTLYQLCCALQRFIRNNGRPELNVFEDTSFKHFQDCLDSQMKKLTGLGVGADVREAQSFTEEQEEKLWSLQLLGDHSAATLLNTMVFLIGRNFALRSGQEHRNLKFSQLSLVHASDKEPEKLVYSSFGEKNNLGGLKHRAVRQKRVEHYINAECQERCLVTLYKKYMEKCPKEAVSKGDAFYLSPRRRYDYSDEVWFTSNPVGKNTLGDTVKSLCKKAGIEGHYTNHSLRATTATRGLLRGVPDKVVMQRTGDRDVRSLQKYQRPDIKTKVEFSKAFECGEVDHKEETSAKRQCEEEEDKDKKRQYKKVVQKSVMFKNCTFNISSDLNFS